MTKTISRKLYNKVRSMYSMRYETEKYEYRIDYFGDILRRSRRSLFPAWDRFAWNKETDNWKLVIE